MAKGGSKPKHDLTLLPTPDSAMGQRYFYVTQRPWPSLVFILPMLVLFEVFTYFRHGSGAPVPELVAEYLIVSTARIFGATGFYLPGLLACVILIAWHVAARQPWKFDAWVLPGMLGESLIWTAPLFVFHRVLYQAILAGTTQARYDWIDQVVRSLGAGIYEELVFRLIAITLMVIIFIDVLRMPRSFAAILIIVGSALLFAFQHQRPLGQEEFEQTRFLFRTGAGLYLAGLFVFRGFGVAAGTHAFYNVIVVTIEAVQS